MWQGVVAAWLACAQMLLAQDADLPVLRPGETVEGVIEDGDLVVETAALSQCRADAAAQPARHSRAFSMSPSGHSAWGCVRRRFRSSACVAKGTT